LHLSDTGEKWEYNGTVHQLFIDFKKAYDSVRREASFNILTEFGVPMIKVYLNKTYNKVRMGKYLSHNCTIQNGLKQGDALSPFLFNFTLENAIRKVQESQVGLKLNGTHQLLVYGDDANQLGDRYHKEKHRNFN
jgi:hypothetical protein